MKKKTAIALFLVSLVLVSAVVVFAAKKPKVWVKSKPGNASVFWDGNYVGDTPANGWLKLKGGNVTFGIHNVSIVKRGYEDWIRTIDINKTKKYKIKAKLINESVRSGLSTTGLAGSPGYWNRTGSVKVITKPAGARINLDGIFKGITRGKKKGKLKIRNVTVGRHFLDAYLNETDYWNGTIRVRAGKMTKVKITFNGTG